MICDTCNGTGQGPCANCGDGFEECACDDPTETECDVCDGTGGSDEDGQDLDPNDPETFLDPEDDE